MSLPTPETLVRHELCGLHAEVVDAPNPDLVGIAGRVVGETTRTLRFASAGDGQSRVRQVPKSGSTFEFALTDEAAVDGKSTGTAFELGTETADTGAAPAVGQSGSVDREVDTETGDAGIRDGENVAYVTVDGARLLSRPARRTETGGVSQWR